MDESNNKPNSPQTDAETQAALLALLQDTIHIGIGVTDEQFRITHVNRGLCLLLARPSDELLGQLFTDFLSPDDAAQIRTKQQGCLAGDTAQKIQELCLSRVGNSDRWLSVWWQPLVLADGRTWCVMTALDITDQKVQAANQRQQDVLERQQEKRDILQLLSSAVGHRINNLLTPILGFADLARDLLPSQSPLEPMLNEVVSAALQASEFAQHMLSITQRKNGRQLLDLSRLVKDLEITLGRLLGPDSRAVLQLELAEDAPWVEVDPSDVRHALAELVLNAQDSLPDGQGTITLRTGHMSLDDPTAYSRHAAEELPSGTYVYVEVIDKGKGIAADDLDKIFAMDYTTKPDHDGQGLANVVDTMKKHDGIVKVISTVGQGTRVQMLFPQSSANTTVLNKDELVAPTTGTVLIIEPDEGVAGFVQFALESVGHNVHICESENDGLELVVGEGHDISLVVLSVSLMKQEGLKVLHKFAELEQTPPLLLITAHAAVEMQDEYPQLSFAGILRKPFSPAMLLRMVQQILTSQA